MAAISVGAGRASKDSLLGVKNLDTVWTVVFGSIVGLSVIFVVLLRPRDMEFVQIKQRKKAWWVLAVIALVLMFWGPELVRRMNPTTQEAAGSTGTADFEVERDGPAPETVAEATDLILLGVGVVAVAALWAMIARRHDDMADEEVPTTDQQLQHDVEQSMQPVMTELRSGGDPRTGVLNAYAVLESVLSAHGRDRRTTETPSEHMRRALANTALDGTPFMRLSRLYELARFSNQEISEGQRDQAIEALAQARSDLAPQS